MGRVFPPIFRRQLGQNGINQQTTLAESIAEDSETNQSESDNQALSPSSSHSLF